MARATLGAQAREHQPYGQLPGPLLRHPRAAVSGAPSHTRPRSGTLDHLRAAPEYVTVISKKRYGTKISVFKFNHKTREKSSKVVSCGLKDNS